ncbi:hypothetical protein FZEAL_2241 [Fusarium zealandicum]|uniref:AAA+ ATPase domain-containing protein n=1 Tax=Fusarium zealandicum TaxID=1053134 RepID=A0A8H4XMX8_9HYPO|nr:hypothetical protein FZEAL_2241 [Fusarium zealandicum]
MEETQASIVPADRHNGSQSIGSAGDSAQKDANAQTTTTETDSKTAAVASSEPAERSTKSTSGSKKHGQRKKQPTAKGAKSSLKKEEEEEDESSESSDTDGNSDSDDEDVSQVARKYSKKHISLSKNKTKKKRGPNKNLASDKTKKATKKATKKEENKAKKQKKKGKKHSDTPSDSNEADSDSSDSSSSSDSDSESDDEKVNSSSSKKLGLKNQFKALQLQVSQLKLQLTTPSTLSPYGAPSYACSLSYPPNLMLSQTAPPPPVPPPISPGRRRPGSPPRGLPPPPPRSTPGGEDTSDESDDDLSGSKKKKAKKGKKNKHPAFKRVDQVWDNHIHNYKLQDTAETDGDAQYEDFIFHVRRTFDWEGKYRATLIDIKSKLLRECLQDVIGNVEGVSLVDEVPKIDPNLLFLYLEDLRGHLKALRQAKPAGETKKARKKNRKRLDEKRKHLKVVIKYLDHDYESTKESLYPMLESGLITFDLLWALWKPNTLAYTTTYGCTSEPRVFKVEMAQLHHSIIKGNFYYVDGKYFEFDGKRFGYGNMAEEIEEFQGARKITSLSCYPLQYHQDEEKVRRNLIERGKKFVTLSGVHYKSYQGIAFLKRKKNMVVKFNIQPSRVMIDPSIFRRINPNYNVSLVKPKDHDILSDEEDSDSEAGCDCECSDSDGEKREFVTKVLKDKKGDVHMIRIPKDMLDDEPEKVELDKLPSKGGDGEDPEDVDNLEFTDEEYLIASSVVLGFAFSEKHWLEFAVSGVKDIKWNEKAWDSLVLEDGTKDLIKALVESRKYHAANTIDDVIQGKGKGLVTVLHGPPGTGKTLTAEGISELLKCPLYMASAGELGTDSRFLEAELQKILDICHAWGAILLLDEADVFLEKRNMHDIHRNALVSIFLRQLEYFQGILFLTTNRVETFDEAFQSRIHIALRYDNLDAKAKRTIFEMFLERVRTLGKIEVEPLTEEELQHLSKQDLNGREIKNVVGSAQDLAVNKGEALSMRHIKQVLNVHAKFGRDLKGGPGFEDAMRSYF